jgi:hypothetical protein
MKNKNQKKFKNKKYRGGADDLTTSLSGGGWGDCSPAIFCAVKMEILRFCLFIY